MRNDPVTAAVTRLGMDRETARAALTRANQRLRDLENQDLSREQLSTFIGNLGVSSLVAEVNALGQAIAGGRSALFDRAEGVLGKRRDPDDPDGRPAVVPAATPRDSGPMRLNLPVSSPVLPVCLDDAGWCVGSSTFEHSPASLVLT